MSKDNFIFGTRAVIEALNSDKQIEKVLIKKGVENELIKDMLKELKKYNTPFQYVPIQKINKISKKNHQGVIAFLSPVRFFDIEEIVTQIFEAGKTPFLVVLDGVTDVRNFGAIVRSAECSGVDAILVATGVVR